IAPKVYLKRVSSEGHRTAESIKIAVRVASKQMVDAVLIGRRFDNRHAIRLEVVIPCIHLRRDKGQHHAFGRIGNPTALAESDIACARHAIDSTVTLIQHAWKS
ncbi:MAG: hypothetical protein C4336_04800, partial [Armatimonadota bacterium]